MNLQQARTNMIEQQIRPWDVLDQRVLDVMAEVPREHFVAAEYHGVAYSDHSLPIGFGQHMLKPNLDGRLLQAMQLKNTDSVLEIGTGSGFSAACLARLARKVQTIEIHPELQAMAAERLHALSCSNVESLHQDAAESWDADDAYDAIVFSGAVPVVPDFYLGKLADGGRLVAIVGSARQATMHVNLLTRVSATEVLEDSLIETQADELLNFGESSPPPAFVF